MNIFAKEALYPMEPQRDLAIVLRSIPFEERHRVVAALTLHHGQISALAKNSIQSRRFGGALEPFTASDWMLSLKPGAQLYLLSEAQVRHSFSGIRKSFERLALASVLSELMLRVAPQSEACPDLFRLHSNALMTLDEDERSGEAGAEIKLLNAYLAKLLQWSGHQPRLYSCLKCEVTLEAVLENLNLKNPDFRNSSLSSSLENSDPPQSELSCRVEDGGWICSDCRSKDSSHILRTRGNERASQQQGQEMRAALLRITPLAVQEFQLSLNTPIRRYLQQSRASLNEHRQLFSFLEALFIYHVPGFDRKPLKSLRFLGLESNVQPLAESFL